MLNQGFPYLIWSLILHSCLCARCDNSTVLFFPSSSDSPVLWVRLDPDITLLCEITVEQPDYQWQYQLKHERDVSAQFDAIAALEAFPTVATRASLTEIIENENIYVNVRCKATHCLTKVPVLYVVLLLSGSTFSRAYTLFL